MSHSWHLLDSKGNYFQEGLGVIPSIHFLKSIWDDKHFIWTEGEKIKVALQDPAPACVKYSVGCLWEFVCGSACACLPVCTAHTHTHTLHCVRVCARVDVQIVCHSFQRQFSKHTMSDIGWLLYNLTGLSTEVDCGMSHWLYISLVCCSVDPYIGGEATWSPQSIAAGLWSFHQVQREGPYTSLLGPGLTFSKERWWRSSSFLMRN